MVQGEIVLQEGQVYCNRGSLAAEETVLQYNLLHCKRRLGRLELYRNTLRCIATVEPRQG